MKPYKRRMLNLYPFYRLAVWDDHSKVWREEKKRTYKTEVMAKLSAKNQGAGRYRISRVTELRRYDLEPFTVP